MFSGQSRFFLQHICHLMAVPTRSTVTLSLLTAWSLANPGLLGLDMKRGLQLENPTPSIGANSWKIALFQKIWLCPQTPQFSFSQQKGQNVQSSEASSSLHIRKSCMEIYRECIQQFKNFTEAKWYVLWRIFSAHYSWQVWATWQVVVLTYLPMFWSALSHVVDIDCTLKHLIFTEWQLPTKGNTHIFF